MEINPSKNIYRQLLQRLTVEEKKDKKYGKPKRLLAYKKTHQGILIPPKYGEKLGHVRAAITFAGDSVADSKTSFAGDSVAEWQGPELYPYQKRAVEKIYSTLTSDDQAPYIYINMPTGSGKTMVAVHTIFLLHTKTLIVTPTKYIADQWRKTIADCLEEADVDVMVINSARKLPIPSAYDYIILDEAHAYCSTCNSAIFWLCAHSNRALALSATPEGGVNGLSRYAFYFFDTPVLFTKDTKFSFTGRVDTIRFRAANEVTRAVGNNMERMRCVLNNEVRTNIILTEAKKLFDRRRVFFIFCEFRDYLDHLCERLINIIPPDCIYSEELSCGQPHSEPVGGQPTNKHSEPVGEQPTNKHSEPVGEQPRSEFAIMRGGFDPSTFSKNTRVILATYGYARQGVSIDNATAAIFATPRKNQMVQIIGRIERGPGSHIPRHIVDIVDVNSPLLSQYYTRKKVYRMKDYSIAERIIDE